MNHELKIWKEFIPDIVSGKKTFEVRKDDRGFNVGDLLTLHGFDNKTQQYTGAVIVARVTYKLPGGSFGIQEGYCVLGINAVFYHP